MKHHFLVEAGTGGVGVREGKLQLSYSKMSPNLSSRQKSRSHPTSLCPFHLWVKNLPVTAPTPQDFIPACAVGYFFLKKITPNSGNQRHASFSTTIRDLFYLIHFLNIYGALIPREGRGYAQLELAVGDRREENK